MTRESVATLCPQPRRSRVAQSVFLACAAMGGASLSVSAWAQAAAAPAAPASAASAAAGSTDLEKVFVTARKREELAVDVPISLLSYSEKELRDQGITDLQSLSRSSGFQLQQSVTGSTIPSGRTLGTISFRGLQPSTALPRDNSGSLFIDGIFISGGQSTVNTVDMASVEVLKGPQNTYFGRNAFGGAINFISKNPPTTFGGQVNASVTGRGSTDTDGTIGGPILDTLRGSLTVYNHIKEAQYRASDGGDLGAEKSTSIGGTLLYTPSNDFWLRFRGHYQRDDDSAAQIGYIRGDVYGSSCAGQTYNGKTAAGAPVTYSPTVPYFCGSVPSSSSVGLGNVLNANTALPPGVINGFVNNTLNDRFMSETPTLSHSGLRRDSANYSLQGSYDLPMASTLGFSLGYNQAASRSIWDLDRSAAQNFLNALNVVTHDLTADVRAYTDSSKPLRGLLGVSYSYSKFQLSQDDLNAAFGATTPTLNTSNFDDERTKQPAVYGSIDYDVTKQITLTGEGRYQTNKAVTYSYAGAEYAQSFGNFLPRAIIQFKPIPDTMTYVSWSKGVQPTGFNGGFVNATAPQQAYISAQVPGTGIFTPQPSIQNLEAGIKQALLDGRIQYSLTAYQLDWKNQQTLSALFNPSSCIAAGQSLTASCPLGAGGSFVLQPNDARIRGLEFSTLAYVNKSWNVGLNLEYKNARWKSYYNSTESGFAGGASRFDGNQLTRVPHTNIALNSTYTAPLIGNWSWFTRGDVYYQSKSYADNENIAVVDGYARVNLRIGAQTKNTTIEVFSTNLFDDKHWDSAYKLTDLAASPLTSFTRQGVGVIAPDRREIGVRLRQAF